MIQVNPGCGLGNLEDETEQASGLPLSSQPQCAANARSLRQEVGQSKHCCIWVSLLLTPQPRDWRDHTQVMGWRTQVTCTARCVCPPGQAQRDAEGLGDSLPTAVQEVG